MVVAEKERVGLEKKGKYGYLFLAKARGKVRGKKHYDKGKP